MEELQQITMDEYLGLKNEIKTHITTIVKSFVRIGETLCKIDETRAYKLDGYSTVAEMAKEEYGMNPAGVSRFMNVYRKYCTAGQLKDGYENYTYAQLTEMLQLPEEDAALIRPETQRESIRELKRFNKDGENDPTRLKTWQNPTPEAEENRQAMDAILDAMFRPESKKNALKAIRGAVWDGITAEQFSELLNPAGNRTVRSGRAMAFFYEREVKVKIWGRSEPAAFTYAEIMDLFKEKFPEEEEENNEQGEEPDRDTEGAGKTEEGDMASEADSTKAEPAGKKKEQQSIAPAQKTEKKTKENVVNTESESNSENQEKELKNHIGEATDMVKESSGQQEEDQIPGQDNVMNHPELLPEGMQTTTATINGHEQEATVEPTAAQRVEECLSLLSCIQGNIALQNYPPALQQAQKLVEHLEALI